MRTGNSSHPAIYFQTWIQYDWDTLIQYTYPFFYNEIKHVSVRRNWCVGWNRITNHSQWFCYQNEFKYVIDIKHTSLSGWPKRYFRWRNFTGCRASWMFATLRHSSTGTRKPWTGGSVWRAQRRTRTASQRSSARRPLTRAPRAFSNSAPATSSPESVLLHNVQLKAWSRRFRWLAETAREGAPLLVQSAAHVRRLLAPDHALSSPRARRPPSWSKRCRSTTHARSSRSLPRYAWSPVTNVLQIQVQSTHCKTYVLEDWRSLGHQAVLPFSKLSKLIFRYLDPENTFF